MTLLAMLLPAVAPAIEPGPPIPTSLTIPFLVMIIGCPVVAVIPWIPTRFSLRTLMIAMTIATLTLTLITCAVRY